MLIVAATLSAALLPQLGVVRDTALPLSNKRILLPSPRSAAVAFTEDLVLAGARPIWCPAVRAEPLADPSLLDDALMRLAEYDVLVLLDPHSIDAIAERMLSIADGSQEIVLAMLDASDVEIGAIGTDARHFRERMGGPVSVSPIEPEVQALATTLTNLGHVEAGAKVLVTSGRVVSASGSAIDEPPRSVAKVMEQLASDGASAERLDTHCLALSCRAEMDAEIGLLRSGAIDAVCAASAEELTTLLTAAAEASDAVLPPCLPLVVALGAETAAVARKLAPDAEVISLGARESPKAVVEALEGHFGAGKLLF